MKSGPRRPRRTTTKPDPNSNGRAKPPAEPEQLEAPVDQVAKPARPGVRRVAVEIEVGQLQPCTWYPLHLAATRLSVAEGRALRRVGLAAGPTILGAQALRVLLQQVVAAVEADDEVVARAAAD